MDISLQAWKLQEFVATFSNSYQTDAASEEVQYSFKCFGLFSDVRC